MSSLTSPEPNDLLDLTVEIVAAYVGHNSLTPADIPRLIGDVHRALQTACAEPAAPEAAPTPAVPIKRAITANGIVCLEDGKLFKSLRGHLRVHHDLTPEQYREKWGLPKAFPMVAPEYSARRSMLAKANGLGKHRASVKSASPSSGARSRRKQVVPTA